MELILLTGCFLFVLLTVLCGGYWFLLEPSKQSPKDEPVVVSAVQDELTIRQTLEKIGSIIPPANDLENPLRRRLLTAGYRSPNALHAFFGIKAISAILTCLALLGLNLLLGANLSTDLLAGACGLGIGYLIPERLLTILEGRRRQRIRQGLPAALDLLVLGLEAGQGLDSTLLDTSRELKSVYPDLSDELFLTHLETRAGQSRTTVLTRLAQRCDEPEIKKLTNLLLDGDRFGTALGPALRNHSKYTRLRRKQIAQEQARKTSVKLVFPVFFLIFPCVLLVTLGPAVLKLMQGMSQMMGN